MESRIADLEMKLAYTEDTVEELNRLLYKQQQQIDALIAAVRSLSDQVKTQGPKEFRSLRDELPPHY